MKKDRRGFGGRPKDEVNLNLVLADYLLQTEDLNGLDQAILRGARSTLLAAAQRFDDVLTRHGNVLGPEVIKDLQDAFKGAVGSSMLIARHSPATESTIERVRARDKGAARQVKAQNDRDRAAKEQDVLRSVIGTEKIERPAKWVDTHLDELGAAIEAAGLERKPSRNTWIARMAEIGIKGRRSQSNT